ncbi:hypothetical protein N7495_005484 [Penicillium taxi]|uniref:uncharacterized protein n=1 Tax=Penicillium taxi TaxID=168475 RepID=UPI0025452E3B|nr:uncharacterized protein N7495_005484 [Penicillium taxi]KAJ5893793.1 hypothetical protein N7495_005484 [Penicillium taxi]
MGMGYQWKASVLLTWLLAAKSVHCYPSPLGTAVEEILERTVTRHSTAFKTQYPPLNSEQRVLDPDARPFYRVALDNDGHPSELPFPTPILIDPFLDGSSGWPTPSVPTATQKAGDHPETHETPVQPEQQRIDALADSPVMNNQDIFHPVATGGPFASIKSRNDHPVANEHADTKTPIETNKFYAGFFLGSQTNASFTQPYSIAWSRGGGTLKSWGMSISHIELGVMAFGPKSQKIPGSPIEYYINPVGLQHMILSASELDDSSVLSVKEGKAFSAHAVLKSSTHSEKSITYPVVQGMGYVTAIYEDMQPIIESGVFFLKVISAGSPKQGVFKYQVTLEDNTSWVLYAAPTDGTDPKFNLKSNSKLEGPKGFSGTIQVAKNSAGKAGEKFYDNSAGVYPVAGEITGSVTGDVGTYSLKWTKAGVHTEGTPLIMFALPHHVESFDDNTTGRITNIQLRTTTKGNATAVIGETWTMTEENLPMDMGFAPWSATEGNVHTLSDDVQSALVQIAPIELQQDINAQTDLNSMYYSGKALSKFATLVYTVSKLGNNKDVAHAAFLELKRCFARFVQNQQQYPLAYDTVWKGVVSTAGYGGDLGTDFGNTAYNDHHFHYAYFIQTAAIIGALDPSWIPANKDWVNTLLRDAGNSVADDAYFPFSRSFDWFNGHSWAKGLFESYDGKDQESTSEDTLFAYAVKMWGRTSGDASMEARGNMMLGIMRRSLDNYFLLKDSNKNQPADFVKNKVTGILFENKVDHTTYFGGNLEFVQGIHMLPLLPNSAYTRQRDFVAEEWKAMFATNGAAPADDVEGGWKGVLYANLALIDPKASWDFFAQDDFDYNWIDGGASRVWYLAYAAALGGAS